MIPIEIDDFLRKASFLFRIAFLGPYKFEIVADENKGEAVGAELFLEHCPRLSQKGVHRACMTELTGIQMVNGWYLRANAFRIISITPEKRSRAGMEYGLTRFQPMRIEANN